MSTNRRHSLQHQLVTDAARAAFGDAAALSLSNTQAAALDLHRAGLNVFPLPYGSKAPAWRGYQYNRIAPCRACSLVNWQARCVSIGNKTARRHPGARAI